MGEDHSFSSNIKAILSWDGPNARFFCTKPYAMRSYQIGEFNIALNKKGAQEFSKVSFPIRYGRFSEIQTRDHIFQFNLNGEIKTIQGRDSTWPNPSEWLKRTAGNDWVYYSAGDYKGVYELFGEYYFPCLSYPSNSLLDDRPFEKEAVQSAIRAWALTREKFKELREKDLPKELDEFLRAIIGYDVEALGRRAEQLHGLVGGQVTVLPPDARHVDYEVIPLRVADGCLYQCGFCEVKSGQRFSSRGAEDIERQIDRLREFYGRDLHNYSAVFLGEHDALHAGRELLEFAAWRAYEVFDLKHSYLRDVRLYLFGSADSLIRSENRLFETLSHLPFYTHVNVGLESADVATLASLQKPITVEKVRLAFDRMLEINKRYERVEISVNFVYGHDLPTEHLTSFLELIRKSRDASGSRGTIYLSPLLRGGVGEGDKQAKRELLRKFYKVKAQSPFPTYLYLIQRL